MVVGAADETHVEGVHPELVLQGEAVLQRVADEIARRILRRHRGRLVGALVRVGALFEPAALVLGPDADPRDSVEPALRGTLDLVDLDQGFAILAAQRVPCVDRILELLAAAQVRVVRDHDRIAAPAGVEAVALDRVPEALRDAVLRCLELARGEVRDVLVAEDHVAVLVAADEARGVLVADEGRKSAGIAPVVGLLGRRLDLAPDRDRRGVAIDARLRAEAVRLRRVGNSCGKEPLDDHGEAVVRIVVRTKVAAHLDVVDAGVLARAEVHLTEELRVVGDRREIEGPVDAGTARRLLIVVGKRERLAARERIGVARPDLRPVDVGVGREAGVHVQVAEERTAQQVEAGAGLAALGALPGRTGRLVRGERSRRRGGRVASREHEQQAGADDPKRAPGRSAAAGVPPGSRSIALESHRPTDAPGPGPGSRRFRRDGERVRQSIRRATARRPYAP